MPQVQFGLSSYERGRGDMPELPVINMFAEEAPTEETGVVLQSRPGLEDRAADMGPGPVQALFQQDNVLEGELFGISAGALWLGASQLGLIDGSGPASVAGYENFLFANAGKKLWGYDGTALAQIAFPDSAEVVKVIVAASRAVAIRKDTGRFYWSDVLENDIEALDFATAENAPDRAFDLLFIDDILLIFGAETVEWWANTQDSELPFQPIEGRVIEKGIKATGCATAIGPTFAWVTNHNQVCLGDENNILSNPGLEEKIAASDECRLFVFLLGGIEFLCLRIDGETHAWNWRSKLWNQLVSYGQDNWVPQCFAGGVFGSAIDGRTMAWSSGHVDLGGVLERRFRGGFPINSAGLIVNNVQLRCNVGQTPFLEGDYVEPMVEMRLSRDAGQTFGSWRAVPLGVQADYRKRLRWNGCGMASQPGFLAEFRVTAPVDFRVSDVLLNETLGGR